MKAALQREVLLQSLRQAPFVRKQGLNLRRMPEPEPKKMQGLLNLPGKIGTPDRVRKEAMRILHGRRAAQKSEITGTHGFLFRKIRLKNHVVNEPFRFLRRAQRRILQSGSHQKEGHALSTPERIAPRMAHAARTREPRMIHGGRMEGGFPLDVPHVEKEEQARQETVGDFAVVHGGTRYFRVPAAARKDTGGRAHFQRMTGQIALSGGDFLRAMAQDFRLVCK